MEETEQVPGSFGPPAAVQVAHPPEELLHTGNAGLVIHRVGQVCYPYRAEARSFARDLQFFTNKALHPYATTLLYEELFGVRDRLHWLIHMRAPNDYARLLEMVDHNAEFQQVASGDRMPERGGGNWERMFVQGSFQERVIVPQHGFTHADGDDLEGLFAVPARHQTDQPDGSLLHSANAGVVIHRTGQVRFEYRKVARKLGFDWIGRLNEKLRDRVSAFLYEEQWGTQDRLHWFVHLRSLDDYRRITELEARDPLLRELTGMEVREGGVPWGAMFLDGTLNDTVLVPHHPAPAVSG
ncbi:DUF6039 family protein [Streptomyces sp. C10-9-1]|uniref:DUF6039 family protein n=1 Tax=Streptomyces sp. C10-9-1 TaxID=1859285 RepID=UPI0021135F73|nr:DUF6039 family protein [Streptomyces sp. C10-9-1]MCQ6552218.1 DUF6039 family protein [Streptomyces sp. C10-9-1]